MNYLQTIIVAGGSPESREEKIKQIITTLNIAPIDVLKIEPEKSIGIEEIRNIMSQLYITPVSGEFKICIFYNFDKATIEAQNALLKIFEEPPKSVFLLATVANIDSIIPTIVSRAQIIKTHNPTTVTTDTSFPISKDQLFNLFLATEGHKITFVADNIKNKDEALLFIDSCLNLLHTELLKTNKKDVQYLKICLQKFTKARLFIMHNVNPKLTLEILLFSLKPTSHRV